MHLLVLWVLAFLLRYQAVNQFFGIGLLLLVCTSLLFYFLRRKSLAADVLRVEVNGSLMVHRNVQWQQVDVLPSSVVTPFLVVLHLRVVETKQVIYELILRDAVDADEFRRLRVWLKWRKN